MLKFQDQVVSAYDNTTKVCLAMGGAGLLCNCQQGSAIVAGVLVQAHY
jgi:hypothetical protein